MEYYTAKSYQSAERIGEPFEKNEKLYIKIRKKCDRCVKGVYAIGVENGHIKPHPVAGGVCFKCGGTGYEIKEVRLYTEEEYNKMEAANERAKQKKAEALEAKMKAEYETKATAWLERNGFSKDKVTYIYAGSDSYDRKEELKQAGFIYNPVLHWHKVTKDTEYEENLIEVHFDEVLEFSAWGEGHFKADSKSIVEKKIAEVQPESTSEWVGEVGDKIKDIKVKLIRKYSFETKYGISNCYHFQTEEGNILIWFSSTYQPYEQGAWIKIKYATIKKHDIYKGNKQTILTRCKLTEN